ncbi:MAG: acetyltransferase [Mycobacterium sp.]|nr:acetyltransferase [Mycobacterium sp.]
MNLALRLLDEPAAQAIVAGEAPSGYRCPDDYPAVEDRVAAGLFLQRLEADLDPRPFGAFLVVLESDVERQPPLVIGGAGFHGGVDDSGGVEIGYGIVPSHQRRGYATRALGLLIERARELGAVTLVAEVDAENAPSRAVLARCGFRSAGAGAAGRFEFTLNS